MCSVRLISCLMCLGFLIPATVSAGDPKPESNLLPNPWMDLPSGPLVIDVAAVLNGEESQWRDGLEYEETSDFHDLDELAGPAREPAADHVGNLPEGWVQRGSVVLPEPVAQGIKDVDPEPVPAWEMVPGNEYPRKHTVFLNFNGGMLFSGKDNSAESKSTLARQGIYPSFGGGQSAATAAANAFAIDVQRFGIRVMYETRPSKLVPYTMVMIGGRWTDTNLEDPAGGVAPGADCEARGQRHVVYTFINSGSIGVANVSSQEAGHAWGLDHTTNCNSVMAYCGGGNKVFASTCDPLCESACQGPNSAGCRLTHEKYCGVGADRQNEDDELSFIFGGNEPDMEPPEVAVLEPEDQATYPAGSTVRIRASVGDNYGGVGWHLYLDHDGEAVIDEVDYFKDYIDDDFNAAINATNLPPGTYTFRIKAEDHADHVVEDQVVFYVDDDGTPTTSSSGGTDGGTSSGGTSGGATDGSSTTSGGSTDGGSGGASGSGGPGGTDGTPTGPGTDSSGGPTSEGTDGGGGGMTTTEEGCGCRAPSGVPGWWGLTLLPLLGFAPSRRRRR